MDVVTGAFGYIGKYIARALLKLGREVKTITTHPHRTSPFGDSVKAYPYYFDQPDLLTRQLRGADTLYNTYWVRFERGQSTFRQAIDNSATLFRCAAKAGVKKVVHISVTKASEDSSLPYFKGKAEVERILKESGLPYVVVRPTVVFGQEDILINNIAWMIRKFPVFPIFGDGQYRLQPVYVGDLAEIAISSAKERISHTLDAIGPEILTFAELVSLMAEKIGRSPKLIHVPPPLGIFLGKAIGLAVNDIVLTSDELRGLMGGLLFSDQAPNASTRFSEWLETNKDVVGANYSSELERHFRAR